MLPVPMLPVPHAVKRRSVNLRKFQLNTNLRHLQIGWVH